jgi:DNA transformation protein and related proteins
MTVDTTRDARRVDKGAPPKWRCCSLPRVILRVGTLDVQRPRRLQAHSLLPDAARQRYHPAMTRGQSTRSAAGGASFLAFVLDQLGETPAIESRAMFGGHGLYRDGTFFAIVYRGRLYFRTTPETQAAFKARGMKPFRPRARQSLNSYYEVPADVLEDAAEVARWARAAASERSERARHPGKR